jgi:hypothetical protein
VIVCADINGNLTVKIRRLLFLAIWGVMRVLRLGRSWGAVSGLAVLAWSVGSASGVAAVTRTETTIVMSQIPNVTYDDMTVTIQGTLETYSPTVSERQPIANEPVDLQLQNRWTKTDLGSVTTRADGTFSLTTTLPTPGTVWAGFGGDSNYMAGSGGVRVAPVSLPTRVTLNPLPATAVAYSRVPAAGSVEMQTPDGQWIPAAGASVSMKDNGAWEQPVVRADSAGDFTINESVADPGPWVAATVADGSSFVSNATSTGQTIDISPAPVGISGFTATYAGQPVRSVAALQGLAFTATVTPYIGGQTADLYFQPRGTTTWSKVDSYPVQMFGTVTISGISGYLSKGHPREGSWQLRTAATPRLQASASQVLPVEVYLLTSFRNLKIKKVGKSSYFQGQLNSEAGPLAGQKVSLYYRTSTTEHRVATITTKSGGAFSIKLPMTHRRWYQVRATNLKGDYDGVISREIYFS